MPDPSVRVTAVIAEDELLLREEIRETLQALWPELSICAEADDGLAALQALAEYSPQILFLDICMPGANGLEVAQKASRKAHIVFITAYNAHAVAAFEQGAFDYVLKPICRERLGLTVFRLKSRLHQAPADLNGLLGRLRETMAEGARYLQWITVGQGQELRLITVAEICYFRSEEESTAIFAVETVHLTGKPLVKLVEELDPKVFWRIDRDVIVNVNAIRSVHRDFGGRMTVRLNQRPEILPVGAIYKYQFQQM